MKYIALITKLFYFIGLIFSWIAKHHQLVFLMVINLMSSFKQILNSDRLTLYNDAPQKILPIQYTYVQIIHKFITFKPHTVAEA